MERGGVVQPALAHGKRRGCTACLGSWKEEGLYSLPWLMERGGAVQPALAHGKRRGCTACLGSWKEEGLYSLPWLMERGGAVQPALAHGKRRGCTACLGSWKEEGLYSLPWLMERGGAVQPALAHGKRRGCTACLVRRQIIFPVNWTSLYLPIVQLIPSQSSNPAPDRQLKYYSQSHSLAISSVLGGGGGGGGGLPWLMERGGTVDINERARDNNDHLKVTTYSLPLLETHS